MKLWRLSILERIFLDNASTTKPLKNVIGAVGKAMEEFYGNASSLHKLGIKSEKIVRETRSYILRFLDNPQQI